jgi:YVTN family beta-propeller protein
VGGLNQLKVFRTDDFSQVATISLGSLPHGIWPSGDGTRVYVGLENADALAAIDTLTNRVIATVPIGQAPQAVTYVPDAVPEGDGTQNLQPLGIAGQTAHLAMVSTASAAAGPAGAAGAGGSGNPPTTVALFDQGLLQVLQASATGLEPRQPYVLGLADNPDGSGSIESLATFMTNPAGSAIVNAIGQIRQIVAPGEANPNDRRRYLIIAPRVDGKPGVPVQVQAL